MRAPTSFDSNSLPELKTCWLIRLDGAIASSIMILAYRRCTLVLGLLLLLQLTQAKEPVSPAGHLASFTSPCVKSCLDQVLGDDTRYRQNNNALCGNKKYLRDLGTCVMQNCDVGDTMRYYLMMEQDCHWPVLDRRREINIICAVMLPLAMAFFCMRAISKIIGFVPYGHDDSLIIAAFIILVAEYMYAITLTLTKLSILAFFLRIFPDHNFRRMVHGTVAFIIVMSATFLVLFMLQSVSMKVSWEGWKEKNPKGVLLSTNAIATSHGAINVALDVWMLILPMTQLWKIGIKPKKKIGIMSMFGAGALCVTPFVSAAKASIVNIPVADTVDTVIWSMVETSIGMIVACMPGARQFVRDILSRVRRGKSTGANDKGGVFIDRPLATIVMTRQDTEIETDHSFSSTIVKANARMETDR
ncbi:unnamed protein product [Fusarium graminearum]|nr:unnamed protein product [Fusarium graminearum]